ncbi:unnamed protein product [Acanthoscelides obtectus]|uniref:Uncharacterized protein n=1 Tax=Acanthoscelides obtectus TaxID=200917 RepID=A0A9P0KI69_ACAOB|nr:unnamed protein product [Acanthoscelides obtectus]CAK1674860.1 hypothetical protein AOBTE_LOCUS29780 [Acanthoscelides obtectus]
MSRDEMHFQDRLLLLAQCTNPHRPFNVKRKPALAKQASSGKGGSVGGVGDRGQGAVQTVPKLSVQDFVRMDPSYTPDIEHLVFPVSRKRNPLQQVAPGPTQTSQQSSKTRSRLAEMFALSRHLQQRSVEREQQQQQAKASTRTTTGIVNVST